MNHSSTCHCNKCIGDIFDYVKSAADQPPDSWRGPEERPEIEQTITAFFTFKNREREVIGYYDADDDGGGIHCYDEVIDWDQVLCWQPIEIGPMPERFKTVKEETK